MKNLKRKIIFILSLAFGLNFISNIDLYSVKRKREYNPKEEPSSKKRKLGFDFSDILINNILPCMASLTNIKDFTKSILQFAKLNKNNLYKINPKLQLLKKLYDNIKNSNIQNKISILSNTNPVFLLCIPEIKQQINDDEKFKKIFFDIFNINKKGFLRTRNPFTNQTLLHFLIQHSNKKVYEEILNSIFIHLNKKDLIQMDGQSNNILHYVSMSGNNHILNKIIIKLKKHNKLHQLINQKNGYDFTPLRIAQYQNNQNIIDILRENEAVETSQGITKIDLTLLNAIDKKNLEQVRNLLQNPNINVNIQRNNDSALLWASSKGYTEIVKELLKHPNINVNIQGDYYGETALIYASFFNHTEIVKKLLQHPDINVNAQNNGGETALIYASFLDHTEIVKKLLQHPDINVNAQNNNGETALITSLFFDHTKIVKELLQHPNININTQNNDGKTALEITKKTY